MKATTPACRRDETSCSSGSLLKSLDLPGTSEIAMHWNFALRGLDGGPVYGGISQYDAPSEVNLSEGQSNSLAENPGAISFCLNLEFHAKIAK